MISLNSLQVRDKNKQDNHEDNKITQSCYLAASFSKHKVGDFGRLTSAMICRSSEAASILYAATSCIVPSNFLVTMNLVERELSGTLRLSKTSRLPMLWRSLESNRGRTHGLCSSGQLLLRRSSNSLTVSTMALPMPSRWGEWTIEFVTACEKFVPSTLSLMSERKISGLTT